MKKIIFLITSLLISFSIISCSDSENNSNTGKSYSIDDTLAPVEEGFIRINTTSKNANNIWIWDDFDETAVKEKGSWDGSNSGYKDKTGNNGDFKYFDVPLSKKPSKVSFIIRSNSTSVSGSKDITFYFPNKYKEIYLEAGNETIYVDHNCSILPSGIVSASIVSENKISLVTSGEVSISNETLQLKNNGANITISSCNDKEIIVTESLKEMTNLNLSYTDSISTENRDVVFSSSIVDEWFALNDTTSLGFNNINKTFKTWAPCASKVQVLLFSSDKNAISDTTDYAVSDTLEMTRNSDGTWISKEEDSSKIGSNKYYQYRIETNGVKKDVCDIWNKVASKNSVASQIVSMPSWTAESIYKNPFIGSYSDAVIYEMHITDWSQAFRSSTEEDKPGTFKEIASALGTNGNGLLGQHLKDLGVTHVQILPMFEYEVTTKKTVSKWGKVTEEKNDGAYNWGYNPYNYNTPESRYVKDMVDGTDAIEQMREMIAAFHDAGISVIMDVVYNHTSGTGDGSLYDKTFPGYFYLDKDYSGCGNSINTENKMVEAFIIDSMKHWMNDLHINGFRFDLMGILTASTMKNIYEALYNIDENVMVYGEPWTGGGTRTNGAVKAESCAVGLGYGAFEDDYRDAIKGAEFGGFQIGQVQNANNDSGIVNGLLGKNGKNNRGVEGNPELSLHYVECHDNYTLFDKLVYSTLSSSDLKNDFADKFSGAYETIINSAEKLDNIKKEDKLAAAYLILSQGTPFINGGQEFLRTKQGSPDSYAADKKGGKFWSNIDEINAVDLSMKVTYSDVYNVYKGLIALRKENSSAFGSNTEAAAETVSTGVTKYTTGDFCVYFNASDAAANISTTGYKKLVDVTSGTPVESESLPATVPAKSFIILKDN